MKMRSLWIALLAVGALVGCGASARQPGEEPIDHLERDLGGPSGVMDLFANHSISEIEDVLADYEMGYVPLNVTDCPEFFPSSDRSKWHTIGGESYYIDSAGRPSRAYSDLPPIVKEARMTSCQSKIGRWGDAENTSNDYDGGHLIGSQLGGWGGRANIVPQDANFNQGNWVALENKMAKCGSLASRRLHYYITVGYPSSTKLVPNTFGMEISNNSTGASVSLSFSNTDGGGSGGASTKTRGVNFLAAQGCN